MTPEAIAYWQAFAAAALHGTEAFRGFLAEQNSLIDNSRTIGTVLIENPRSKPMELALEPLGMFFDVPPATTYELIWLGSGDPDLEQTEDGVRINDVDSWNFGLFKNGVTLKIWPKNIVVDLWAEQEAAASEGIAAFEEYLGRQYNGRGHQLIRKVGIRNSTKQPVRIYLEPLGMEHELPASQGRYGSTYKLVYLATFPEEAPVVELLDSGEISVSDIASYQYQFFLDGVAVELIPEKNRN